MSVSPGGISFSHPIHERGQSFISASIWGRSTFGMGVARFILEFFAFPTAFFAMELITILNRCHRFPGFVYRRARFSTDRKTIEVTVTPRLRSTATCSGCHKPATGYDRLPEAYERVVKGDVKYRFVLDNKTLKS